jgi:hypothetical protein
VYRGLIWLAFLDLRRAWLRSSMTTLAIALALIAVTFFVGPIGLLRAGVALSFEWWFEPLAH